MRCRIERISRDFAPHVLRVHGDRDFEADVVGSVAAEWTVGSTVQLDVSTSPPDSGDDGGTVMCGVALDERVISAGGLLVRCPSDHAALQTHDIYYVHLRSGDS
jgi:hypothetical protein